MMQLGTYRCVFCSNSFPANRCSYWEDHFHFYDIPVLVGCCYRCYGKKCYGKVHETNIEWFFGGSHDSPCDLGRRMNSKCRVLPDGGGLDYAHQMVAMTGLVFLQPNSHVIAPFSKTTCPYCSDSLCVSCRSISYLEKVKGVRISRKDIPYDLDYKLISASKWWLLDPGINPVGYDFYDIGAGRL
jgi:hypothetical protein